MYGINRAGGFAHSLWEMMLLTTTGNSNEMGKYKGLLGTYVKPYYNVTAEWPIDHGSHNGSSFYQGLPGMWGNPPDVNSIIEETLEGYIYAPIDGEYKFKIAADDDADLKVNGQAVLTVNSAGTSEGSIFLTGEQWYPVHINVKNSDGDKELKFYWNLAENQNYFNIW
jgi:hypothetical protein